MTRIYQNKSFINNKFQDLRLTGGLQNKNSKTSKRIAKIFRFAYNRVVDFPVESELSTKCLNVK